MFLKRLTELMKEKCDGKQTVLAQNTGIAQSTISCYFIRKTNPSIDQLKKLADFFEVSIDYLIGRENDFGVIEKEMTDNERKLLTLYGKLTDADQNKVLGYIQALSGKE